MINVAFSNLSIGVGRHNVAKEKLVDNLEVRPRRIEIRILLIGIRTLGARVLVGRRRKASENVGGDRTNELILHLLGDFAGARLDEIDELEQGLPLRLLLPREFEGIGEIEGEGADLELSEEEGLAISDGDVSEKGEAFDRWGGGGAAAASTSASNAGGVGIGRLIWEGSAGRVVNGGGGGGGGGGEGGGLDGVGFGDLAVAPLHEFVQHFDRIWG